MQEHVQKPEVIQAFEKVMGLLISEDGKIKNAAKFCDEEHTASAAHVLPTAIKIIEQVILGKTKSAKELSKIYTKLFKLHQELSERGLFHRDL